MRIRPRKNVSTGEMFGSLALVRSVYDPVKKRNREVYIGSVRSETLPEEVPAKVKLRAGMQFKDEEVAELKAYLRPNVPLPADPLQWLKQLPKQMRLASSQIEFQAVELKRSGHSPKDVILPHLAAAEAAWKDLFRSAQAAGLKRTVRRRKA